MNGRKNRDTWNTYNWISSEQHIHEIFSNNNPEECKALFKEVFKKDKGYIDGIKPNKVDREEISKSVTYKEKYAYHSVLKDMMHGIENLITPEEKEDIIKKHSI